MINLFILNFCGAAETWPFLISLLIKSASAEISSSKWRNPKMIYARIVAQRVEDAKCSDQLEVV